MTPRMRTNLADILLFCAGLGLAATWFFSGHWPLLWSLVASAVFFSLILVAAIIRPPFWWGIRTFTTPVNDPSHEAKNVHET